MNVPDLSLSLFPNELIIIGIIVIILLFGATKLPAVARALGRSRGEYRKGQQEAEKELGEGSKVDRTSLEKAARELGIDPTGKTDEELKEALRNI